MSLRWFEGGRQRVKWFTEHFLKEIEIVSAHRKLAPLLRLVARLHSHHKGTEALLFWTPIHDPSFLP